MQGHCILVTQFSPSHHISLLHLQAFNSISAEEVTPGHLLHEDGGSVGSIISISAIIKKNVKVIIIIKIQELKV